MNARTAALAALLALAGCGPSAGPADEPAPAAGPAPGTCERVYTFAPGNFIVDIAAGSVVAMNPGTREFPVFCTAREARDAVDARVSAGRLPEGDWRVYLLEGTFEDIGAVKGPGRYVLGRRARLVDWEPFAPPAGTPSPTP